MGLYPVTYLNIFNTMLNMSQLITDVDFRFYVQSAHYFANLQECSAGYWIFIEHFTNVLSIILSAVTTSELISDNNQILGKSFLPWAGAILTMVNAFKAYLSPAAKAEAHHQTAKYFNQLKLSFGNCNELTEYNHLTNMYQTNITNAPGLPFFLRKRWISRKERISVTPQLQKHITRTNDYSTTRGVSIKPGNCCCRINSQIEVVVSSEETLETLENEETLENDLNGNHKQSRNTT